MDKNLAEALSKFQLELKPILKESNNPFFKSKYADLAAVCSSVYSNLGKYGLSVVQKGEVIGDKFYIKTVLKHVSGEQEESIWPVITKENTPQGIASGSTYARRYSLMAIVGACSSDDDDAEKAEGRSHATISKMPMQAAPMPTQEFAPSFQDSPAFDNTSVVIADQINHGSTPMPFGKTKGLPINQHNRASIESAMQWAISKGKFKEFVIEAKEYLQYLDTKNSDLVPKFDERDELPF